MWQENLSWKEGLFTEVSVGRLSGIRALTDHDPVIAYYERINGSGGNNWHNLRLNRILLPNGQSLGALERMMSSGYFVAVDSRLRTLETRCEFTTRRAIQGSIQVAIEYLVKDVNILLTTEDPVSSLRRRVEQTVQDMAFELGYPDLTPTDIREALLKLETEEEIGIQLFQALCEQVQWPNDIQTTVAQPVLEEIQNTNQDARNSYRRGKLAELGITDPLLVTSVLGKDDSDFQVIVNHAENYANSQQSKAQDQINLLMWLEEKDLINRADVQQMIPRLLDQVNESSQPQGSISSFLTSSPQADALPEGSPDADSGSNGQDTVDAGDSSQNEGGQNRQTSENRNQNRNNSSQGTVIRGRRGIKFSDES